MAEKIIDIKLNAKEAEDALEQLSKDSNQLEDNISDLNGELFKLETQLLKTKKGSKEFDELNKKIKLTRNSIKRETLELKSNNKQKARLNKQTRELNKKLKEQAKNHNDVSKGITKSIGGTGVLDRATGGLFSSFQGLTQGSTGLIKSFGLLRVAAFALPFVGLATTLAALVASFTSSEEGQNRFTKALNQAKAVIANVTSLLTSLGNGITNAFSALFSGDFDKAGEAIVDTFDTVSEKVSTLSEDIKEDVKSAGELSDLVAKADKIDRKLLVQRQKDNIRINDLRVKAFDTEKFNNEERIKFLEEAIKIEDGITNKEIEAARLRFEAKKKENDLVDEVRKEDADEQAKLQAKLFQLEAVKINRQREVANQRQALLRKEKADEQKIIDDAEKDKLEKAQEIEDILNDIEARKEDEKAESELEKINLEEQRILAELDRLNATEEQKTQITQFFADKRFEIEKNNKDKEKELDELVLKAKLQQGKRALGLIAEVAGSGSAIGKAAAVASATISGIEGVQNAFSTAQKSPITAVNPSYPFIQAGLAGAFSAVQIAKILQTKTPNTGTGGGSIPSGGGRGAVSASPSPPDFNVVGASPTNQLAETIGQQQDKPVKAFVVSTEISSQQELDRNTENNAQIG
jgi:hypothetical protein